MNFEFHGNLNSMARQIGNAVPVAMARAFGEFILGHYNEYRKHQRLELAMARFQVRARTVDMLGRQQIAGIPTAISELFKNAHDAYARCVEVDYFRDTRLFIAA